MDNKHHFSQPHSNHSSLGEHARAHNKRYRQEFERNLRIQLERAAGIDGAEREGALERLDFVPVAQRVVNTGEGHAVLLPPALARLLKPHQLQGIRFCWSRTVEPETSDLKGCILAHSMGLGKTLQMVAFVHLFLREQRNQKHSRYLL